MDILFFIINYIVYFLKINDFDNLSKYLKFCCKKNCYLNYNDIFCNLFLINILNKC